MKTKALVIFSGGQDSTTCLYWALDRYDEVRAITFNYGQRHSVEVDQSKLICEAEDVPQTIIDVSFMDYLSDSALFHGGGDVNELNENGLPASFVPNRNQLFITIAHAHAQQLDFRTLVAGVCETDYSGYPDCRQEFIVKLSHVTNLGSNSIVSIETPLMHLDKAQTFKLADKLGRLKEVVELSHTCYYGERDVLNDWGYGCGKCNACKLRERGYFHFSESKRKNNILNVKKYS